MAEEEGQEDFEEVYDDNGREEMMDSDEISPEEDAFMQGYDQEEEDKEKKEDKDKPEPEEE